MANIGYQPTVAGDVSGMPSVDLWHQYYADIEARPGSWFGVSEDFDNLVLASFPTSQAQYGTFKGFSSSGGTFAASDEEGGVRQLVEATENESVSIAQTDQPFKIIQDAGELIFEARIKRDEITGTWGFFLGLIESVTLAVDVPLTITSALADNNMVGFQCEEADPANVNTAYKANGITAVTVQSNAITLVADTYAKLGMVFNRKGDNVLRFYKDGVELDTAYTVPSSAGTDFPNDVRMGWVLGMMNGAGAACDTSVDWIHVAQKRTVTPA